MTIEWWIGPVLACAAAIVASSSAIVATRSGILRGPIAPAPIAHPARAPLSPEMQRRVGGVLGLLLGLVLPWPGIAVAPLLCIVGVRVPAVIRRRAEHRRRAAIDRQIPQLLDLLAAASSAGLSGQLALRRAVSALGGPLGVELEGALGAVALGGRWRDELVSVAERLELPDLRRTVAALSRTEMLGASLADPTVELAASVRAARRAAVAERARTAPIKMLFPLVFLVLPAFLLLTVVPVLLSTVHSFD